MCTIHFFDFNTDRDVRYWHLADEVVRPVKSPQIASKRTWLSNVT